MKTEERRNAICPMCGKTYTEHPAISREDDLTEICPECGVREALGANGVHETVTEEILSSANGG